MNNESSLLKKQLFLYISIILATLTLFGVSTSRFFGEHYINNTKNALITQGEKISQQYAQSIYTRILKEIQSRTSNRKSCRRFLKVIASL